MPRLPGYNDAIMRPQTMTFFELVKQRSGRQHLGLSGRQCEVVAGFTMAPLTHTHTHTPSHPTRSPGHALFDVRKGKAFRFSIDENFVFSLFEKLEEQPPPAISL